MNSSNENINNDRVDITNDYEQLKLENLILKAKLEVLTKYKNELLEIISKK